MVKPSFSVQSGKCLSLINFKQILTICRSSFPSFPSTSESFPDMSSFGTICGCGSAAAMAELLQHASNGAQIPVPRTDQPLVKSFQFEFIWLFAFWGQMFEHQISLPWMHQNCRATITNKKVFFHVLPARWSCNFVSTQAWCSTEKATPSRVWSMHQLMSMNSCEFQVHFSSKRIWWFLLKKLHAMHHISPSALTYLAYHHHGATALIFSILTGKFETIPPLLVAGARLDKMIQEKVHLIFFKRCKCRPSSGELSSVRTLTPYPFELFDL